jgi:hypothetical protein
MLKRTDIWSPRGLRRIVQSHSLVNLNGSRPTPRLPRPPVRQLEMDRRVCAEGGADHVSESCMTQRGYVFVREDQAEPKRVELAEAEKIRREATAQRSR